MLRQPYHRRACKIIRPNARRMFVELLEGRHLLAADAVAVTPLVSDYGSDAEFATQSKSSVLVFVDSAVEGYENLIQDFLRPIDTRPSAPIANWELTSSTAGMVVVILNGDRDGIVQISETLSQFTDVSAIHLLSHGSSGSLQLGNTRLHGGNLDDYATQLSEWGQSLAVGADILLYGCNVADGTWGIEFVDDLAEATGTDVAASNDLTGAAMLGGDWILETSTGIVENPQLFADADYRNVLYDVCSDSGRCTHEEMAGYAGQVYTANVIDPQIDIEEVKLGAGHEDEIDHIYGWHTSPIPGSVTFTHFWDADAGRYTPSFVDGPALVAGPFENSWQKAEQYWSLALGEYANGNTDMAYHFLGHIAHQMGDNTLPTHVHVSAHDPFSGDDSLEDWMSQGNGSEAPGSDLLAGELETLIVAGPLDIPEIPGRTETPLDKLYWLLYTTNQIADFFPSDRVAGDTFDPEGFVQAELDAMDASISTPRTTADLLDNDITIVDYDNNEDGDLGVIRQHSYLRGIRAIAALYQLFEQTVLTEPIVVVTIESVEELVGCSVLNEDCDFYSRVTIDGFTGVNEGDECFDCISQFGNNFFPNWAWGQIVDTSGSIPIKVEILDDDNVFSDGLVKIIHEPGTALDLTLDLAKCLSGEDGAITGNGIPDGVGRCNQSLVTNASADDEDVDDQGIARVTFSIKMSNRPPVAFAGGSYTVDEGGSVVLTGGGSSDPDQSTDSLTYEWDLDNNGSFETPGIYPIFTGIDGPSNRTVRLRVTDDEQLTDIDQASVTIENVEPFVTASGAVIDENGVATVGGTITDPGVLDSFTVLINWGEGSPVSYSYPAGSTTFSETHKYLDDNPSNTASDTYNIDVTVTDKDGGDGTANTVVTVNNVPAKLQNVQVTPALDENGVAKLKGNIVDPGTKDTFTLVVDWGEGAPQTYFYPAGTKSFSETHQYFDDNPTGTPQDTYNIALNLRDDDSGTDSATRSTLVKNVKPVVTAFTSDAVECGDKAEGNIVHVVGAFTDVGTLDTHAATISWGDGTTSAATIVESSGVGTIAGEHIYTSGGIFRIDVTLTDDDTGQTTEQTYALITGVGILNGQLQAVGTKQADNINVNLLGNGQFSVHTSFLADSPRHLPAAGVASIAMMLCDGNDRATVANKIDLPTYIAAGEGNDELNGGNGPNILLGGEGNDRIIGGSRHDILVGGIGADRIIGSGGDDILIAGTLTGADDPIDQLDALLALLVEWDLDRDRAILRPKMIIGGDNDADSLTGGAGADWYFFELGEDIATDLKHELAENLG